MILAFKFSDLITVPFGWLLGQLYHLTNNYGIAMILFALVVQTVMVPMRAKSKKSMMKMSRLTPIQQEIQRKYANDPQKQNEMINKLYKDEGVSMGGGCLWALIPMFILFPLFTVIRNPITYMLGETAEVSQQIIDVIKSVAPAVFEGARAGGYYDQVIAASAISTYAAEIQAAIPGISAETLAGMNFDFLGINLGAIPNFSFWTWDTFNWANIGLFLIPLISAGAQVLQMWISTKMNNSVITDKNGVQDQETADKSQQAQTNKSMMITMPLMSLWIGFTVSAGLSMYWFIGGLYSTISDIIMTKKFRTIYDAEDAARLKRHMEELAIEQEKERIRAEKRAANPDGITSNTSKKKLQKQLREQEEAARAAATKEYNAKRGIVEEVEEKQVMSGIPERPYCKGRNYDPNRYKRSSTEE